MDGWRVNIRRQATLACGVWVSAAACAQVAPLVELLQPVVVTGARSEPHHFEIPAALDLLDGETMREQQLGVNLSESLARVPGLLIQNRQNYAQDLQVSARGFGARATFGVRGVRLIQDGIPLTMPDGQGQTGTFDLDGAERVEVLRGPFAALYGNAAGGVIRLFTEDVVSVPHVAGSTSGGSFGTWRVGLQFGVTHGGLSATGNVARFETQGYRDHSMARRDTANIKLRLQVDDASSLSLIVNALEQPDTQDPLGLTQAQLDADRRQAGSNAELFDTKKSVAHRQAGLAYKRRIGLTDTLELIRYGGQREMTQRLAIPVANQGMTSSGGLVDLDRDFGGVGVQWRRTGADYSLTFGVNADRSSEVRRGFVNDLGVQGALRRDETDRVRSIDPFVIANWQFSERWSVSGGVRHSQVDFSVSDRFVTATNPDDSGSARYRATLPVIGLLYRVTPKAHLFASLGRGFETPTFAELAYRPDGSPGLNFGLKAARSTNAEFGTRARLANGTLASMTLFRSATSSEVVPATSAGGRNTFTNADRTQRDGAELALDMKWGSSITAYIAYTHTRARFRRYITVGGADLSGKRIPGVSQDMLYGELAWQHAPSGFGTAVEWRAVGKVFADDANNAAAGSYNVVNLRAGWLQRPGNWELRQFVRVENALNEAFVGSVIVNEGNKRYFEPAPMRALFAGVSARYAF